MTDNNNRVEELVDQFHSPSWAVCLRELFDIITADIKARDHLLYIAADDDKRKTVRTLLELGLDEYAAPYGDLTSEEAEKKFAAAVGCLTMVCWLDDDYQRVGSLLNSAEGLDYSLLDLCRRGYEANFGSDVIRTIIGRAAKEDAEEALKA